MSKRDYDGEINESSKKARPNDSKPNEIPSVSVRNEEPPTLPAIFKLNAICCDDLFEWLSIAGLHSLGQTCKRLRQLTGLYFQANFKPRIPTSEIYNISEQIAIHFEKFHFTKSL